MVGSSTPISCLHKAVNAPLPMRSGSPLRHVLHFVLAAALIFACWNGRLDSFATDQVEAGLTRALLAFAIARGLNGVISVAQGTEVALEPAGVGVKLSPGEILDPVNDLVEQFSSVMLLASASLGLQKLLLLISAWHPLSIAISALAVLWALLGLRHVRRPVEIALGAAPGPRFVARRWIDTLLLLLVALRFAVPLSALASETAYQLFLRAPYEASSAALDQARTSLRTTAAEIAPKPAAEESFTQRAQRLLESAQKALDVSAYLDRLQQTAADVTRHVVNLIAIFVLQTVLFPLLFLWLLVRGTRALLRV
jgi:hypothetical protein